MKNPGTSAQSASLAFAAYFIAGGAMLHLMKLAQGGKTENYLAVALLVAYCVALTVMPWLAARYVLNRLPPMDLRKVALLAFSVSAAGLGFAVLTALLGNAPGFICHVVQGMHVIIAALSLAAFLRAGAASPGGSTLLRWSAVLYFLGSWFMPSFKGSLQCMGDCTEEGWKLFNLSLFDLNIVVSAFMGFMVWRAVSLAKKMP